MLLIYNNGKDLNSTFDFAAGRLIYLRNTKCSVNLLEMERLYLHLYMSDVLLEHHTGSVSIICKHAHLHSRKVLRKIYTVVPQ